jgi:membrane protein XagC
MTGATTPAATGAAAGAVPAALAAAPIAALAFVAILLLAAIAVRHGLIADDALRLWAGASTAADGEVPIGRIAAAYPTLPFVSTTLVAWLAPADAPAPELVAAAVLAVMSAVCFGSFRRAGLPSVAAAAATLLVALHPALLRAVVAGPGDMFLAAFLLMLCLALYDLRARSGTAEVMNVGLALMALAFSHPMGAVFAFAAVPFLAFAVRPALVANSAPNVLIALVFPTLFALAAFSYVAWIFPGDGWTFFAAAAESLSLWTAAVARMFGGNLSGVPMLEASVVMALALAVGAPLALVTMVEVRRRRPLVVPALVFVAAAILAIAVSVSSGVFGDPAALVVAAPVLAAGAVARVPVARERLAFVVGLLAIGWFGGLFSLALVDPLTVNGLAGAFAPVAGERIDALAAGGAAAGRNGVLVDVDDAPAFVLGRGRANGILGPQSEAFALALLFDRIDAPLVAVPDPQSRSGASDRLDAAFPSLFRDGLAGYRLIYQNNTWRLFERSKNYTVYKQ